ncbi:hypothetical protein Emag_002538 [Eimeria magna]
MQGPSPSVLSGSCADAAKGTPAAATTCIDSSSENDEFLTLVGACGPEDVHNDAATKPSPSSSAPLEKEEEEGAFLSGPLGSRRILCSRGAILSTCCGALGVLIVFLLVFSQMSGDIGGPLGERFPIGNNIGYKGPTWRKDRKCENLSRI